MPQFAEAFGKGLRERVLLLGSISQACLATGINRQQFNKYLAGQIIPNARNMRKICGYLRISEEQLMAVGHAAPRNFTPSRLAEIDWDALPPGFSGVREAPADALRNGLYHAHFPVHGHPDLVARWLVHVFRAECGGQLHTCRNRFKDGPALGFAASRIRYRGPVGYGTASACLNGSARIPRPMHGAIYLNLKPVEGADYFTAMVLTHRPSGPLAMSGIMRFLGSEQSARDALAACGAYRRDELAADPVIARFLRAAPPTGPNWMQSLDEKSLRTGSSSEGFDRPEDAEFLPLPT